MVETILLPAALISHNKRTCCCVPIVCPHSVKTHTRAIISARSREPPVRYKLVGRVDEVCRPLSEYSPLSQSSNFRTHSQKTKKRWHDITARPGAIPPTGHPLPFGSSPRTVFGSLLVSSTGTLPHNNATTCLSWSRNMVSYLSGRVTF